MEVLGKRSAQCLDCNRCSFRASDYEGIQIHIGTIHPEFCDEMDTGGLGKLVFYQKSAKLFHCHRCFFTSKMFCNVYYHILAQHTPENRISDKKEIMEVKSSLPSSITVSEIKDSGRVTSEDKKPPDELVIKPDKSDILNSWAEKASTQERSDSDFKSISIEKVTAESLEDKESLHGHDSLESSSISSTQSKTNSVQVKEQVELPDVDVAASQSKHIPEFSSDEDSPALPGGIPNFSEDEEMSVQPKILEDVSDDEAIPDHAKGIEDISEDEMPTEEKATNNISEDVDHEQSKETQDSSEEEEAVSRMKGITEFSEVEENAPAGSKGTMEFSELPVHVDKNVMEFSEEEETTDVTKHIMEFSEEEEETPSASKGIMEFSEEDETPSASKGIMEFSEEDETPSASKGIMEFSEEDETPSASKGIMEFSEEDETPSASKGIMEFSEEDETPSASKGIMEFSEEDETPSASKGIMEFSEEEDTSPPLKDMPKYFEGNSTPTQSKDTEDAETCSPIVPALSPAEGKSGPSVDLSAISKSESSPVHLTGDLPFSDYETPSWSKDLHGSPGGGELPTVAQDPADTLEDRDGSVKDEEIMKHVRRVKGKFYCMLCECRPLKKGPMVHHLITKHDIPSPFVCKTCGKTFLLETHLKNHQSTHTMGLYKCTRCSFQTDHSRGFKKHQTHCQNRHKENESKPVVDFQEEHKEQGGEEEEDEHKQE